MQIHTDHVDRLTISAGNNTDAAMHCNLCNYRSYLSNIKQYGVDGQIMPTNEKALKALFESKLYKSLDESCKRVLITAIRKLSHSSDSNPVRMSLMAMHVQTEAEADAERLKKDSTGISLRALLDSLPTTVVKGEHQSRVNDILYSLADENKGAIRLKFASWVKAIPDPQERTILEVIYRALWFSNPYGVRNLGLRMLLQEEVPECWDSYKRKEGRTLRELLLKYRNRISGRREFLANDTLYKLKEGCTMEIPPLPRCTCGGSGGVDRRMFLDNDTLISYFRKAIRDIIYSCGGDEASTMLLDELYNRHPGEYDEKNLLTQMANSVVYLMRYDVLCYLLSKRYPELWVRMTDGNKGSRKCRKDNLVEIMKSFEDFHLVTYKVRTPIITIFENRDLRASALPFVPSNNGFPSHTEDNTSGLVGLDNISNSVYGINYQFNPTMIDNCYVDSYNVNENLFTGRFGGGLNAVHKEYNPKTVLDSPRLRAQNSLKNLLGLYDKENSLKSGSSTTCTTIPPVPSTEWIPSNSASQPQTEHMYFYGTQQFDYKNLLNIYHGDPLPFDANYANLENVSGSYNRMVDSKAYSVDWIIACTSPLNGVYNNMDYSPGHCWETMIRYMKSDHATRSE